MTRLAGFLTVALFILPALAAPVAMHPTHPVGGYRCWTEINAAMPDGTERICQATR